MIDKGPVLLDIADGIARLRLNRPDAANANASLALAQELAAGAPKALAATKRLVWAGTGTSIEQCLSEEARTVSELSGMADAREGLAAVIERRKPKFTGR